LDKGVDFGVNKEAVGGNINTNNDNKLVFDRSRVATVYYVVDTPLPDRQSGYSERQEIYG
jgi:hypothetical protein